MSLDTFFVLDSDGQPIAEDGLRLAHIKEHLSKNLANISEELTHPHWHTPRKMKSFAVPTETSMSLDEVKNVSVLEVSTPDNLAYWPAWAEFSCRSMSSCKQPKFKPWGSEWKTYFSLPMISNKLSQTPNCATPYNARFATS